MCKSLNDRADFHEYDRLANTLDLEKIAYKDILFLFIDFIKKIALEEIDDNKIGLSREYTNMVLDAINIITNIQNKFEKAKINEFERVKIWKYHDKIKDKVSLDKLFLRVAICCFFDESFAIKDSLQYNTEDVLDNFYTLLYELEPKLCKKFTNYILLSYPPVQTDPFHKK